MGSTDRVEIIETDEGWLWVRYHENSEDPITRSDDAWMTPSIASFHAGAANPDVDEITVKESGDPLAEEAEKFVDFVELCEGNEGSGYYRGKSANGEILFNSETYSTRSKAEEMSLKFAQQLGVEVRVVD